MNSIYDEISETYSLTDIKKGIQKVQKEIEKSDIELKDLSIETLNNMIYLFEKSSLTCRKIIEKYDKSQQELEGISIENDDLYNDITVEFDGKFLSIKCPFTFKRFFKKESLKYNYVFMKYIKIALINYQKEHGIELKDYLKPPISVMIIRNGYKFNRAKICDNDNLENGRIINEIFDVLLQSDNANNMDLYSCFRANTEQEYYGMEFIVCSQKDFMSAYKRYISGPNDPEVI